MEDAAPDETQGQDEITDLRAMVDELKGAIEQEESDAQPTPPLPPLPPQTRVVSPGQGRPSPPADVADESQEPPAWEQLTIHEAEPLPQREAAAKVVVYRGDEDGNAVAVTP